MGMTLVDRVTLAGLFALAGCASAPQPAATAPAAKTGEPAHNAPALSGPAEKWKTIFADEFDGPDGTLPDPARWVFDTGGWGWGNKELEYYVNGPKNAFQRRGFLHLSATKGDVEMLDCWYGPCEYGSARIKTKGKFAFTYGRVSARIQVPKGQGIWPAFWMLGANIDSRGWPGCGEIDVMEVIGREPRISHGTIHGPGYSGPQGPSSTWSPERGDVGDDFHVFALDWEPNRLRFYVDGALYGTRTPADLPPDEAWVFDHDFFLLLNVAVGGTWPGDPDASTPFPAEMLVDWVRVEVRE
jgi:beta-glucanase (GH16 family)